MMNSDLWFYMRMIRGREALLKAKDDIKHGRVDENGTPISLLTGFEKERAEYKDWLKHGGKKYDDKARHRILTDDRHSRWAYMALRWAFMLTLAGSFVVTLLFMSGQLVFAFAYLGVVALLFYISRDLFR